jgi:hypothetical protein
LYSSSSSSTSIVLSAVFSFWWGGYSFLCIFLCTNLLQLFIFLVLFSGSVSISRICWFLTIQRLFCLSFLSWFLVFFSYFIKTLLGTTD